MSQRVEALGAIHGETQRFECQVIGYPTPTVTWFKDEVDISENVRYQIDYNQEQGVIALIIRNVTLADEGLYLCKAENSEGHATTTAYLVVKVDPSSGSAKDYSSMTIEKVSEEEHSQVEVLKSGRQTIIEEVITRVEESEREEIEEKSVAPKIIYDPVFAQDLSLKVGATIAFEVNIRGYPRPSVAWFVGSTQLEDSSRVSVEVKEGASSLKVRSVTGEDAGTYKVMAENALGLDTATFKVIVKAPPSPPQNLHVTEVFKDFVVVSWEPPKYDGGEKLSGYEVEKSLDGMIFVSAGYVDSSVLRHKIIRLQEGFDYIFRVSAENRIGLGDPATLEKPVTCKLPFDPPSQPRDLTVKEYSKDFIVIGWNEPEGNGGSEIIQYVVEKCDVTRGGHTWVVAGTVGPAEKTFRASRLFQGNLYLFRVVAENQAGPGPAGELAEPVMAKLPYDTPGAPTNVRVKDYWSDSITIAWDAPEHDGGSPITSYLIEQRDALHPKWIKAASLDADVLHYKAGNLLEGTDYTFQVFAVNKLGPGTEAGQLERPCKAKMPFDPPFAPAQLEVTDYGTNHVTLSWSAPEHDGGSPIVGYIIERHDALVGIWTQVAKTTTDVLKATVAGLFEGQSYLFRVAAVNQCGQGLHTETTKPVTTLLPYSKPSKPQNLKVLNIWRDYAMIGWDEPSDDGGCPLTGFTIEQRDVDETCFKFVAAVGGNVTQHQVTNLLQGHEYYFRVFAQNSMGLSDQAAELWTPVKTSLPCEIPSAPLNVHVTETGNGLISIAWQAPKMDGGAPISGYLVETCLSVSTNWRRAGLVDGNTMAFNLTGLVEGDYYFVRVYSENEAGRSRRAAEILEPVRAKQPSKVPGPPTNLRATEITASTITVSWDMPKFDGVSDATQHIIDARESEAAEYAAAGRVDGRINYFTLENLDKGKQYFFRVRSKNSAGFCETAAELGSPVQPKDSTAVPLPPESFQVSETTDSSLKLSWICAQKPTRYVIEQRDGLDGPFFLSATPEGSTTSIVIDSLIPNQLYSFRIWSEVEGRRSETCAQVSTKQTSTKRTKTKDEVDFDDETEIVRKTESGFELSGSLVEKAEVRKIEQLEEGTMKQVDPKLEPAHLSKIKQVEQAEVVQVEPAEKQDFVKKLKQEKQEDVETREREQAKAKQTDVKQESQEELKPAEQVEQAEVKQLEQTEVKKVQQTEASIVEQAETKQVEQAEVKQEGEAEFSHVVQTAVKQVDKPEIKQVEQAEVKSLEKAEIDVDQTEQVKQTEAKQLEKAQVEELEQDKAMEVETTDAKEVDQEKVKHVERAEVGKVEQIKVTEVVEVEQAESKLVEQTEVRQIEQTEVKQVEQTEVKQAEQTEVKQVEQIEVIEVEQKESKCVEKTDVKQVEQTEVKQIEQTKVMEVEQKEIKQLEETEVKQVEQKEVKKIDETEVKQVEQSEVRQAEQAEVQPCERFEQTETIQVEQKEAVPVAIESKEVDIKLKEETEAGSEEQAKVSDVEQSEVKTEERSDVKNAKQAAMKPETKQAEDVTPVEQFTKLEKLKSIEQETEEESSEEEYFEDAVVDDTESEIADSTSHETPLATGTSNEARTLAVGKSESVLKEPPAALKEELLMEKKTNLTEELSEGIIEKEEARRSDATQVKQDAEIKVTTEGTSTSSKEQTGLNKDVKTEQAKEPTFEKEILSSEEHISLQKLPTQFSNISARQLTSESIVLSWEPPKDTGGVDVLSYIIVMRDSCKNKYKKVGQVAGSSSLTYEVSNLKEGHEYWFRIFAENSFGISKEFADMEAAVKVEKKKKEKKPKEKLVVEGSEVNKQEKETVVSEEVEEVTVTTTTTMVETIVEEVSQTSEEKVAAWLQTGRVTSDDAPLFDSTPETVLVKEGETIRLPCRTKENENESASVKATNAELDKAKELPRLSASQPEIEEPGIGQFNLKEEIKTSEGTTPVASTEKIQSVEGVQDADYASKEREQLVERILDAAEASTEEIEEFPETVVASKAIKPVDEIQEEQIVVNEKVNLAQDIPETAMELKEEIKKSVDRISETATAASEEEIKHVEGFTDTKVTSKKEIEHDIEKLPEMPMVSQEELKSAEAIPETTAASQKEINPVEINSDTTVASEKARQHVESISETAVASEEARQHVEAISETVAASEEVRKHVERILGATKESKEEIKSIGGIHESQGTVNEEIKSVEGVPEVAVASTDGIKPVEGISDKTVTLKEELKPVEEVSDKTVPSKEEIKPVEGISDKTVTLEEELKPVEEVSDKTVTLKEELKPVEEVSDKTVPSKEEIKPVEEISDKTVTLKEELKPVEGISDKTVTLEEELKPVEEVSDKTVTLKEELKPVEEVSDKTVPSKEEIKPVEEISDKTVTLKEELKPVEEVSDKTVPSKEEIKPVEEISDKTVTLKEELKPVEGISDKTVTLKEEIKPVKGISDKTVTLKEELKPVEEFLETTIASKGEAKPIKAIRKTTEELKEDKVTIEGVPEKSKTSKEETEPVEAMSETRVDSKEEIKPVEEIPKVTFASEEGLRPIEGISKQEIKPTERIPETTVKSGMEFEPTVGIVGTTVESKEDIKPFQGIPEADNASKQETKLVQEIEAIQVAVSKEIKAAERTTETKVSSKEETKSVESNQELDNASKEVIRPFEGILEPTVGTDEGMNPFEGIQETLAASKEEVKAAKELPDSGTTALKDNVEAVVEGIPITADGNTKPEFLLHPLPVNICEGEAIRLKCCVKGQPPPEVKFYKGEERLKPRKKDKKLRLSYDVTDDLFVLEISNATVEDAGVYHIKAVNKIGSTEAQVVVTVTQEAVKSDTLVGSVPEIVTDEISGLEGEKKGDGKHVHPPETTTETISVLESSQTVVKSSDSTQATVKEDAFVLKSQLVTEELLDLETSLSTTTLTAVKETFKQTDVKEELVVEKKSTREVSVELNVERGQVVSEVTDHSVKEGDKHKTGSEPDVKGADEQTEVSEQLSSVEINQNVEKADSKIVKVTKEDQLLTDDSEAEKKIDKKAVKAIDVEYTEEDVAVQLPVFDVKPEPVAVNEGETIRLTWKISQNSKAEVGWTKNGKKLKVKKDKRLKVGFDAATGNGFLEIAGADLNDIGEYALNVENEHGRIIQVVFVNVVSKSEGKPPKLEEYPKPQIVSEGQAFEVSCQVSGEPPPEVEFLKNGRPVDVRDSRITVSRTDKTFRLQVTDAVPGDSGKYTVTATNERGRTSHTVSVDVQGTERSFAEKKNSPEFLTKLVPVKASAGEAVKLSIAIKDSEDTNVSWFKDGSPLISEGNLKIGREENIYFLEIEGSTVQDSGEYTCTANSVGGASFCTASVEVSAPPVDLEVSQQVPEKDTDLISFETGKEKVDKDELDSSNNTQKDSQTDSQKDSQKDREKDGQSSDEEIEDDVEKSYPQYVAVTKYTSTDGQGLDVEEDEIIEVLNSKGSEMWLCRKPEDPEKHGWVPARFLIAKSEATKLDTRSTQEVFREDVIKITNKQQEAIMKRRYALKDLWESERDYVRDLNFTMESYRNPFQEKTPDVFAGRTDILFSSLPSLLSFHDKFLDEIMNCSNDPDSLSNCFLSAEQSFQLYIPYLKTRPEADQILDKEDAVKFLKEHDLAIGNVGEQKLSLPHYLQRPSNRLHEYAATLKDFMRYSVRANQNTAQLERAVVMLESLRKKADDQLLVDHITNYDGLLAELGPVLYHENFSVWRGEATGKGKDCHIFLFKDKLLITRKRKSDTPTYECKTVINLQDVLINELGDRRFELCFEDLSRGKYTLQGKLAPVSDAWCQLLATLIPKWGRKPEFRTKVDDITCKEGAPIHITASVYGQPLPDVSWYFNGQPIIPKGDYKITSDGYQQTLAISSVAVSMSGRYSAKAKNQHGEEELCITLTVEEDLIEPKFTSELRKCDVLLGADAKFSVKISGKPLPTVKWFKDGVELAESARLKLLPVDSQTQILILTQVEESDVGVYECRAETKAGATSSKAKLNITDLEERKLEQAPEFITALRDTLAIEGNETQLTVTFCGRPMPEVKWFYEGKDLTASNEITQASDGQNALLTIKSTRPEHSGRYSCCLSNRFGSVEVAMVLSVASPPLLTGDFGNQERNCGETASFVCSFKSLPRPDVTWCRNGQELTESDRIAVEITDSLTTLTIKSVEPSDEGDYSCHLVNAAGETICSAKLACLLKQHSEVDGNRIESDRRPVFLKAIENQEVVAGGLAKFCCEATGHPFSTIKWFKDREELRSTDRVQMDAKDGVAWISITDVRDTDAGCYQCTLSNADGETSSTAVLNVQSLNIDLDDEVAEKKLKESKLLNVVPVMSFDKPLLKEIDLNTLEISWLPATLPPTARQTPISYVLERKDLGDVTSSWVQIRSGLAETVFHLIDYSPTKDFLYRVYAENQFGSSDPTLSVTYYGKSASEVKASKPVYRECLPPKTPKDKPTITELKDDALKILWQASELPAGATVTEIWYIVERRCPPSKNWIEIVSETKDTEYEMHDYRPEKDYMFRIRAGNEYGLSEPSMSATLFTKPPESSKSLRKKDSDEYKSKVKPRTIWDKPEIADMIGTALTLRWKASSIPPYAVQTKIWYIVEQRIPPDTDWTKIATDLSDTEMRIKYSAANDYYFRVRAANEFGIAEPSMPVMLRKKEDVLESDAEMLAKKKKEKAERDFLTSRRVPDHLRIIPEFLGTPEDTQYGVEGRTSEIVLRLRAFPEPKVTWNFHNTRIEMGGKYTSSLSSSGELVLQIHDFSWSEVGEYKAIIENEFGAATRTIKIDMADPPTFLEPMKDQIFNLHQIGRLECRVHGIPYPTIQFKKDWRPVAGSHRIKASREDFDHWSLNIQNSIRTDEGVYECIAENVAGKVYCTANVKIAEKSGLRRDIKFNGVATEEYFHVIDELGRGSYGVVRRVIDKNSGSQYAAKFLRYNDPLVREELAQELEMMSLLDHNNIVQVIDGYEEKKRLVVVMEIVTGGELFQRLVSEDSLMESEAAFYLRQLLLAVEYMHAQNVIHLDLKPENLLLSSSSSDELKVIDFGFARRYNPKRKLRVKYASPEFCSPEVARDESITPATDLWSVGVIAYILLTGVSPFHAESPRQTLLKIQAGKVEFPSEIFAEISEVAQEFISKLLEKDPRRRMSATEAIEHPFLCLANHRGLGNRIGMDRHRAYMFRRKWERGSAVVRTIVQPKPLSAYMVEAPAVEVDMAVPVLHMPGGDESDRASLSGSIQLEAGASAMLQIMGPPSMMSATPSVAGSGSSSEWGREYEDEDTWYEFSSAYQTGPDTHLFPSKDTGLSLRMAKYRRTSHTATTSRSSSVRSLKERRDLRDLDKELDMEDPMPSRFATRGSWQQKNMMMSSSEGYPPIFKEKIHDKAYCVGDPCTLKVRVIGNPQPIISWYRNDELLTEGGRVRVTCSDDGRHSLTILQTKPNDFGVYKSVARNKYGTVTCRARMLCGDHPSRPGRPHVTKISDRETFMIWEEPESDGNSYIQAYKLDWHRPGDERWTTATYCIDECALIKRLRPDTSYRFRVSAVNKFGPSPYSWASVEIRTKKKGASSLDVDSETKRILLRSRQATSRPSPEASPSASPFGSTEDLVQAVAEEKARQSGLPCPEVHLQEADPGKHLQFGSEIWRGRFSIVLNVQPKEGVKIKRVAKVSEFDPANPERSLQEYEVLKAVRQEHVIRLYEAFLWDSFVVLVFEKLYGENVVRSLSLKNRYSEYTVTNIIKQVLDALQFLHHHGMVHLNIQPDNVIMQSRRRFDVKLVDFGQAHRVTTPDGVKVSRIGTAEFMAPEKVTSENVGVAGDVWGVGVLAFILLSGISPFYAETDEETFSNIEHVRYDAHALYHNVTKFGLKFLFQTLRRNPKSRLTVEECLDHRWLMLNQVMVKSRRSAVFSTDKLKFFLDDYITRRMRNALPPKRLVETYGSSEESLWPASDDDDEPFFAVNIGAAAKSMF